MANRIQSAYDLVHRVIGLAKDYNPLPKIRKLKEGYPFHREQVVAIESPISYIGYGRRQPPVLVLNLSGEPKGTRPIYSRLELKVGQEEVGQEYVQEINKIREDRESAQFRGEWGQFSGKLLISKDLRFKLPPTEITEILTGELHIGDKTYSVEFSYSPGAGQNPRLTSISKKPE